MTSQASDTIFAGIQLAPTYCPTDEDFADPIAYIRRIRPTAEKHGICRIVVPEAYRAGLHRHFAAIDKQRYTFETKTQRIHQLQRRQGPVEAFFRSLSRSLERDGDMLPPPGSPKLSIEGRPVDLYKLFFEVQELGGVNKVCQLKLWRHVLQRLKLNSDSANGPMQLQQLYTQYLSLYERRYRRHKKQQDNKLDSDVDMITCSVCGKGDHEDETLLCDGDCGKAFHTFCLKPPLKQVPLGEWICSDCTKDDTDFGFVEGPTHSLVSFKTFADDFKHHRYGARNVTSLELERDYWRIVENAEENVQVYYGSDVDVQKHGSLHPTDRSSGDPLALHGWNPNNLPLLPDCMLRLVDEQVPGVTHPMVYIGMMFSTFGFCWHNEDNYLYSTNYLVAGAPKLWYGVPGGAREGFEKVMHEQFPDLYADDLKEACRVRGLLGCGAALLLPIVEQHAAGCWAAMVHLNEGWSVLPKELSSQEMLRLLLRRWIQHCQAESERTSVHALAGAFSLAL